MLTIEELPVEAVIMSTVCSVRTYYNNDGKLVCHSDEGVAPAAASTKPQAKKCAVCFNNQWGSRITPNGKRGKACAEFNQLTLRQADSPDDAMSLRVSAASLRSFRDYEKQVTSRGEALNRVVTKIDVVHEERRSSLVFRVIRFLSGDELNTLTQASMQAVSPFAAVDGYTQ